jgi:hypothetical protein
MKRSSLVLGLTATVCALGAGLPTRALAEVSDADLQAIKQAMQQLGEKVRKLEETHEKDQEQIRQLQQKVGAIQKNESPSVPTTSTGGLPGTNAPTSAAVMNAINTSPGPSAAPSMQPVHPIPTDSASANRNFGIYGDAEVQFSKSTGTPGGFVMADFAPIFLYRANDNVLFEAGFDFILQNNANTPLATGGGQNTSVNLSFATLDYMLNDYLTLVAGNMLGSLGTYNERSAGWLNKFPDGPMTEDLLIPGSMVGAQLRGAVPIGETGQSLTYAAVGGNGPGSADGAGSAASLDLAGNVLNTHYHPSGGGRLGWFVPISYRHDFEIGVSGQSGEWNNVGNQWSAAVVDAALHLGPNFEAKGEYIRTWYGTADSGNIKSYGWWAQAGYKLAGLNLNVPFISNLEMVGRYDTVGGYYDPATLIADVHVKRYTVGYVYYITNALLFEGDYEFVRSSENPASNEVIFQLSYGF